MYLWSGHHGGSQLIAEQGISDDSASEEAPVAVCSRGELGVGKGLLEDGIYYYSEEDDKKHPFISPNLKLSSCRLNSPKAPYSHAM